MMDNSLNAVSKVIEGGIAPLPSVHSGFLGIHLVTAEELARELRFEGTTSSFRRFCRAAGIEPVPGRRDCYDPAAVRYRLDAIQGLGKSTGSSSQGALTRSVIRRNG